MKKRRTLAVVLIVVLVEIVLAVAAVPVVVYSGLYNVAATVPHSALAFWVLDTTMDHSVARHAASVTVSPIYNSPDLAEGYEHYSEMCVVCHGAPGVDRGEIGEGLNPDPPDLAESVDDMTPSEVYWVVKNGIKMTGMPAFGPTHDEQKLWNITAFVKRLPTMSGQEYKDMARSPQSAPKQD